MGNASVKSHTRKHTHTKKCHTHTYKRKRVHCMRSQHNRSHYKRNHSGGSPKAYKPSPLSLVANTGSPISFTEDKPKTKTGKNTRKKVMPFRPMKENKSMTPLWKQAVLTPLIKNLAVDAKTNYDELRRKL